MGFTSYSDEGVSYQEITLWLFHIDSNYSRSYFIVSQFFCVVVYAMGVFLSMILSWNNISQVITIFKESILFGKVGLGE